ncbi:MAG: hypothetical protein L0323_10280 [Planctomycetes bacterium]|nr:hypothetical protein [Planctomycetota bacterium]
MRCGKGTSTAGRWVPGLRLSPHSARPQRDPTQRRSQIVQPIEGGGARALRARQTNSIRIPFEMRMPGGARYPEALLSSLPSRPREGTLVVRFFRDALPRSEPPFELLTMYFLPGTVPVAMELLPAEGSVLAAGKHLVKLLAMPGFPAPRRLETDCAAFLQHGGEALGEAGIDARDNEGLPPEREVLLRIKAHLERES